MSKISFFETTVIFFNISLAIYLNVPKKTTYHFIGGRKLGL